MQISSAGQMPATLSSVCTPVPFTFVIINGIAAIKRHQTTISAELNQLKRSNQLLWQESLAARQRHQKHQDTINRSSHLTSSDLPLPSLTLHATSHRSLVFWVFWSWVLGVHPREGIRTLH
ncbi:hypothetical protein PLEOSDRAFT_1069359 [Pleurotus ostreatus PC15]|uniref:Uncharacterized protein n=1 Tax=Pleurotus ostreatus (strain PC15) TaxID=1137138 RepID=A0A067P9M3_PLEO1|nr:hypothetical protein PLEOSDRAFT_1069359 [Pleurotus ostreatus PC15]